MQLSPIDVNVDLDINLTNSVMDSIHVNQYENNVRQIRCHIKNDGVDYSLPSDADVRIRILKPSKKGVYVNYRNQDEVGKHSEIKKEFEHLKKMGISKEEVYKIIEEVYNDRN